MSCLPRTWIAVLCLAPLACVAYDKPAATEGPSENPPVVAPSEAQQPVTETPSPPSRQAPEPRQTGMTKGELLVTALPAGVEGLEIKEGAIHLQTGYEFVKGEKGSFTVARRGGGAPVVSGGCGCSGGTGDCDPEFTPDGIIVCASKGCTASCGLAVTLGGTRTELVRF
jgi:hypothetical protein